MNWFIDNMWRMWRTQTPTDVAIEMCQTSSSLANNVVACATSLFWRNGYIKTARPSVCVTLGAVYTIR